MNTRILILLIGLQLISAEYTWNGQEWVWTEPAKTKRNIDDGLLSNDIGSGDIIDENGDSDDEEDEIGSGDLIPIYTTEGSKSIYNFLNRHQIIDRVPPIGSKPTDNEVQGVGEILIVQGRMGDNNEEEEELTGTNAGSTLSTPMIALMCFWGLFH